MDNAFSSQTTKTLSLAQPYDPLMYVRSEYQVWHLLKPEDVFCLCVCLHVRGGAAFVFMCVCIILLMLMTGSCFLLNKCVLFGKMQRQIFILF